MTFQFNKTIITFLLINNVEARVTVRTNIFQKYVLKHKSAKVSSIILYAVGKLEASLNKSQKNIKYKQSEQAVRASCQSQLVRVS